MQFSDVSIVTPTALYVQMLEAENAPVKKQVRIKRDDIASDALSPEMRGWVAISRVVAARVGAYSCHARERVGACVAHAETQARA
jgi:hypothetical protein